jgi:hypothetical protein
MFSGIGFRLLAVTFAVVFAFVAESPAFANPCPVHDPAFANLASGDHHAHHATQHQRESHHCTCVGCASCVVAYTLPSTSPTFAPAIVVAGSALPLPPIEKHARCTAEHERPFSTAPPPSLIG